MKYLLSVLLGMFLLNSLSAGVQTSDPDKQEELSTGADIRPVQEDAASQPYQIVITPTLSRAGLREIIADVEEDFYEKFNELNIDDSYDIVCYRHTPTGSHIWRRVCEPIFMYRTRGEDAAMATFLLGAPTGSGGNSARASSADYMMSEHELARRKARDFEILQELMEELSQGNSEFRQIGEVLAELRYRLNNYGNEDQ